MERTRSFLKTTLLGGLVVILPATIVIVVFRWLFYKVTDWIQPLTDLILAHAGLPEIFADVIVVAVLLLLCFLVGVLVRTSLGRMLFDWLESRVLRVAPGYSLVKETVNQFLGRKRSPFGSVALVQLFGNRTLCTAFITDEHEDGGVTAFVPTGPNPTSGQIFHLPAAAVHRLPGVGVEQAMRSIISCGAGSAPLVRSLAEWPDAPADASS